MEILQTLGVSDEQLKKISPELAVGLEEMKSIAPYLESADAPTNLVETYATIERELNNYIQSPMFAEDAKKAGVKIKGSGIKEEEEIVIEEAPKVKKTLKEIAAERRAGKTTSKPTIEEPIIEEPTVEEPIEAPTIEQETQEVELKEEINGVKLYKTAAVSGGAVNAQKEIAALLSFGGASNELYLFGDISTATLYFKLELPKSSAYLITSLPNAEDYSEITDLNGLWEAYLKEKTAAFHLIGDNKEEVSALTLLLGTSSAISERDEMTKEQLSGSFTNDENYELVNSEFSSDVMGVSFYETFGKIEKSWKAETALVDVLYETEDASTDYCTYGLRFSDFVYKSKEAYYRNGGNTIVTNRITFYVPKGLTKFNVFAETGGHLNDPNISAINPRDFKKDTGVGKTFQSMSGKIDKAHDCRIIGSSIDKYAVACVEGDYFLISKSSFNYFKKYYSATDLTLKLSDNMAFIMLGSDIVGMIPAEFKPLPSILGVYDYKEKETDLRNIAPTVYDDMISFEQKTEEEVEEAQEKEAEGEDLRGELEEYFAILSEFYEEAKEDGEDEKLLEEFELELDFIADSLEEVYEESGDEKALTQLETQRKTLGI